MTANRKTAYLTYSTDNLGDDTQSFALCQVLGQPDMFVDRDRFPCYADAGPILLVANGFFTCGPFPPPPNIEAIYVAICASSINGSDPSALAHLRAAAPIGCRDQHTVRWCRERGIPHYFSSCPTLLLERTIPYNPDGPIVLVDVSPTLLPQLREPVTAWTNRVNATDFPTPEARFGAVQKRLELLQRARLVITNRLHVAVPCLGMGVPLILVEPPDATLAFLLTALPESVRRHKPEHLKAVSLNPDAHRYDCGSLKRQVFLRLRDRLALAGWRL